MSRKRQYTYGHGFLRGGADEEADLQQVGASTNASAVDPDIKYVNLSVITSSGVPPPAGGVGPQLVFEVVRQGAILQNASDNVVSVERFGVVGAQIPIFVPHVDPASTDPYATAYKIGVTAYTQIASSPYVVARVDENATALTVSQYSLTAGYSIPPDGPVFDFTNIAIGSGVNIGAVADEWTTAQAYGTGPQQSNLLSVSPTTTVAGDTTLTFQFDYTSDPVCLFTVGQLVAVNGLTVSGTDTFVNGPATIDAMPLGNSFTVVVRYSNPFVGGTTISVGSTYLAPIESGFSQLAGEYQLVAATHTQFTVQRFGGAPFDERYWNTTWGGSTCVYPPIPNTALVNDGSNAPPPPIVDQNQATGAMELIILNSDGTQYGPSGVAVNVVLPEPIAADADFATAVNAQLVAACTGNTYVSAWNYTIDSPSLTLSPRVSANFHMTLTRTSAPLPAGTALWVYCYQNSAYNFGFAGAAGWEPVSIGPTGGFIWRHIIAVDDATGSPITYSLETGNYRTFALTPAPAFAWNCLQPIVVTSTSYDYSPAVFTRALRWTPQYPPPPGAPLPLAPAANGGVIDLKPGDRFYCAYDPPAVLRMVNDALADIWASLVTYTGSTTNTGFGTPFPGLPNLSPNGGTGTNGPCSPVTPAFFTCNAGVLNLNISPSDLTSAYWGVNFVPSLAVVVWPWMNGATSGYPKYFLKIQMNYALFTHLFSGFAYTYEPVPDITACGGLLGAYPSSDWTVADGGVFSLTMPPVASWLNSVIGPAVNYLNYPSSDDAEFDTDAPLNAGVTTMITVPQAASCTDAWAAASALVFTTTLPIISEDDTDPGRLGLAPGALPTANRSTVPILTDIAPDLAGGVLDWGAGTRLTYAPTIKRVTLMSGGTIQRIQVAAWWRSRDTGGLFPVTMGAGAGGELKLEFRQKR